MEREFNVGDHVTIVDEPYMGCPADWTPGMSNYCSKDVVIKEKIPDYFRGAYCYKIDADNCQHNWYAECFKQVDPPDFEVASEEEMLDMLGIKIR